MPYMEHMRYIGGMSRQAKTCLTVNLDGFAHESHGFVLNNGDLPFTTNMFATELQLNWSELIGFFGGNLFSDKA